MHPEVPSPFLPWLGLFETLRIEKGRALLVEEHWTALNDSARELGLPVPIDFRERTAVLPSETGRWRWIVTPENACAHFHAETPAAPETFSLEIAPQRLGSHNWDARHKTFSHLTHWQARRAANAKGADEALLLNEHGIVASGAMSNVFWVDPKSGELRTPALAAGCRNGAVRQWVLAQKEVAEGIWPLAELETAGEIFLTNSWIGIKPVTRFRKRTLPPGPLTLEFLARYGKVCNLA